MNASGRPIAKRHGSALVAASHPGHFEYRLGTSWYLGAVEVIHEYSHGYNLCKVGKWSPFLSTVT